VRIALVNNFFHPRTSGSSHLTEELAARLARQGHDVLVVTASYADAAEDELRDGYRIVRLPSLTLPKLKLAFNFDITFAASPANARRMFALLDDFKPDVVHQHGQFFDLSWIASVYARRRRVPAVLSVHTRLEHPSRLYGLAFWLADVTLVRLFVMIARPHVVVMDRPMHRYIRARYGIPERRLAAIPVGIDPDRFGQGGGDEVRERLGLGERPVVLSLGHVIPIRNRIPLVAALPRVLERFPDVALVVVGRVYDDRFLRLAEELGVAATLVTTGAVPKDEVPGFVDAADLEVHDLDGIGLGMASLEIMAAGVPTIAAVPPDNFLDVELRSWENVVLVPPDDAEALAAAIVRLLDDRELAGAIGAAQQDLVGKRFSLDVVVDEHVVLYERAIADRAARAVRHNRSV
jgi:1,2-diacylglycerol 3-alpha-glucosyltransferase